MAKFKQKKFSKKLEVVKKAGKYLIDHPILPVSTTALGINIANYKTNKRRTEEGKEYQEAQLQAMKDLNENITRNNEALLIVKDALGENSKRLSERRDEEYKPISKKRKKNILAAIFRPKEEEKDYSIQEGGFKGRKVEPQKANVFKGASVGTVIGAGVGLIPTLGTRTDSKTKMISAGIGALVGSGLGALVTWLDNVARKSVYNTGLETKANSYDLVVALEDYYTPDPEDEEEEVITTTENYGGIRVQRTTKTKTREKKSQISPIGMLFNIDADPKKHVINILLRGNVMVILINKPTNTELNKCNIILDNYCKKYRFADYSAEKLGKDAYLVEVNIVKNSSDEIVIDLIDSGLKVNILTTDRFGYKNK